MSARRLIPISFFARGEMARCRVVPMTWSDFIAGEISAPREVLDKGAAGGFSLARFRDNYRSLQNLEQVYALTFDFDHAALQPKAIAQLVERYCAVVYTTHSHTPEAPRSRAILRLARGVSGDEYARCWTIAAQHFISKNIEIDQATRDGSRLWYAPAHRPGAPYEWFASDGVDVDVDRLLARAAEVEAAKRTRTAPPTPSSAGPQGNIIDRARRYVSKMPASISGQGGHAALFAVARKLICDFELNDSAAWNLIVEYNERSEPKWSERELTHKIKDAKNARVKNPMASRGSR